MKKKKVYYNGKLLYFRRNNEEGHTNVVIVGDENKLGGRDLAYTHKGERKNAIKKAFIRSVDGYEDLNWPRIFEDIKLTDNVPRDHSVHEYIKDECSDISTWDGEADEGEYNTREAFIIKGNEEDGSLEKNIYELHERIVKYVNEQIERKSQPIYEDSYELIMQIFNDWDKKSINCPHIITELATRYGKCQFGITMFDATDARIMVLTGYVGTIISSFYELIHKYEGWEHYKVINPDDPMYATQEDCYNACMQWLSENDTNRIIYWVAVTGTSKFNEEDDEEVKLVYDEEDNTTFERRIGAFTKLMKKFYYALIIDEVDFGAHCKKQQKKLRSIAKNSKCRYKLSMTGTNADYAEKIWPCDLYYSRNYIDLLSISKTK